MQAALLALALAACGAPQVGVAPDQASAEAKRLLVVYNANAPESREVAAYYAQKRRVPTDRILSLEAAAAEEVTLEEYKLKIELPVREKIAKLAGTVDFILLIRGVPIRIRERGYSVDGHLAAMNLDFEPIREIKEDQVRRALNPYFGKSGPFSSKQYGFYLVTRLDGYTATDARALVDRSLSAKPAKGPFLFDVDPRRTEGGNQIAHLSLVRASQVLRAKGFDVRLDEERAFVGSDAPLAGYTSWGSNSSGYSVDVYRSLQFLPGALCETYVSTSARTFRPATGGQSLIADLIAQGVTGVKGYVSEPYTFALARPDVLFDRYTSGRNLAESFYSASPVLKWKDVVIGDPLCSPYAGRP